MLFTIDEGEHIARSLGGKQVMILRNHGLLSVGSSIEQTLYKLFYLERACEIQIVAMSAGTELIEIPELSD